MNLIKKFSIVIPLLLIFFMSGRTVVSLSISEIDLYVFEFGRYYIIATVIWLIGLTPFKKVRKSGWVEVLYNLFPVEVFLTIVFAERYFYECIVIVSLFVVSLFAFACILRKETGRNLRSSHNKKCFQKFFLALAAFFSFIPCMITISFGFPCSYTVIYQSDGDDWNAFVDEAEAIMDGTSDIYVANKELILFLQDKKWKINELQEKVDILQQIVNMECIILGVDDPPLVSSLVLRESVHARYLDESNEIQVNTAYLSRRSAEEVTKEVLHTTFHAYQSLIIKNIEWDSSYADSVYFCRAKAWRESYMTCISDLYGEGDDQPLEIDANTFSDSEWKKFQRMIAEEIFSSRGAIIPIDFS